MISSEKHLCRSGIDARNAIKPQNKWTEVHTDVCYMSGLQAHGQINIPSQLLLGPTLRPFFSRRGNLIIRTLFSVVEHGGAFDSKYPRSSVVQRGKIFSLGNYMNI